MEETAVEKQEEVAAFTELEFESVMTLKLSDAIRNGSKYFPQAYGWGDGVNDGCALTAAFATIQKLGYEAQS